MLRNWAEGVVGDGGWDVAPENEGSARGNKTEKADVIPLIPDVLVPEPVERLLGKLTIASGITGALFIATGFIFCFLGRKLFKPTLFLAGFYMGGIAAYLILNKIQTHMDFGDKKDVVYVICVLVVGAIVGGLCLCFLKLALLALGALLGLVFAQLILMCGIGSLIDGTTRTVIVVIFMILTAILVVCTERTTITLGTSFIGATVAIIGIDVFAHTGLTAVITMLLQYTLPPVSSIPPKAWGLLAAGIVLAIIGAIVQFKSPLRHKHDKWRSAHGAPLIVTLNAPNH
ncbi:hypothetical protein HK097_002597, partial [Rhizophlyctis rosea]